MQITTAIFKFPFEDEHRIRKFVVGGALLVLATFFWLFPLAWLLGGYNLRLIRRAATGEPPALPEWDDWGELFVSGLKAWLISMVYLLPMWVPMLCAYGGYGVGFVSLLRSADNPTVGDSLLMMSTFGFGSIMFGFAFLIAIPFAFLAQVALARFAVGGSMRDALQLRDTLALARSGFKQFAMALVVAFVIAYAIGIVSQILIYTIVLLCVYPFAVSAASYYAGVVQAALLGQAYYHATQTTLEESSGADK